MTCSTCRFTPPCATLDQMRERHGTPSEFRIALHNALMGGFVTWDEVAQGVERYQRDWDAAMREAR